MRPSHFVRLFAVFALLVPALASAQAEEEVVPEEESTESVDSDAEATPYDEEYVEEEAEPDSSSGTTAEPTEAPSDDDAEAAEIRRRRRWLAPQPSFTVHGYMRVRGEWQDHFALGRTQDTSGDLVNYPFRYFLPVDRNVAVLGGCTSVTDSSEPGCFRRGDRLRYGNMRMRLAPSLALSDDVRVHMVFDVFDNMVLGSTPDSSAYLAYANAGELPAGVPLDFFTRTQNPAVAGRNAAGNSIYVRRAWAEVSNRDLGELRFGRMANHWGLGMMWNAGAGIDSDYSTDVDRVMVSRQFFGFTLGAAWDFMDEGVIVSPGNLQGLSWDGTNNDDVRQFSFFAARALTPEEEAERLARGDVAFVGGLYYQYRSQDFGYVAGRDSTTGTLGATFVGFNPGASGTLTGTTPLVRRGATSHTIDGWARLRWKDLRVEFEGALVVGDIRNTLAYDFENSNLRLLQFGYALETEYRLFDRKFGLYFDTGYATGDRDVNGMSIREDTVTQDSDTDNDGRVTHFTFHPNYRIDLILFRNILGAVGGAYYFRPGLSYDLIHSSAGQVLGVRADVIYSRAASSVQVYGPSQNLGLELDASVYYRSEDGPDLFDGYWAAFNFGLLFPMDGLDYRPGEVSTPGKRGKAMTMRVVLGVNF